MTSIHALYVYMHYMYTCTMYGDEQTDHVKNSEPEIEQQAVGIYHMHINILHIYMHYMYTYIHVLYVYMY